MATSQNQRLRRMAEKASRRKALVAEKRNADMVMIGGRGWHRLGGARAKLAVRTGRSELFPGRRLVPWSQRRVFQGAHSTVKCNGQISGAEENLARGLVTEYLSGARVEFVLDPLDIGIGQNREVGTFWEVLPEEAVSVFVEAAFPRVIGLGKIG